MLNLKLIMDTQRIINPYILKTPLNISHTIDPDKKIYLKNEGLQVTKSFKMRGALSKMLRLSEAQKAKGVIAVSSGNHGVAVSYVAQLLDIKNITIIVPKNTPSSKTDTIEFYGAKLIVAGNDYDEAHAIGMNYVKDHQMTYIDAYDLDPLIYAGQGTIGLEILSQLPNVTSIVIPIGGGGLITGIASAVKAINPKIKIIGVQTEACPAMKASLDEKICYTEYPSETSVCEALIGGIGRLAYEKLPSLVDDILLVKEEWILKALNHMLIKERTIIEASSAVVVAAIQNHTSYDFGENPLLVISGSNIDTELMKEVLN